MKYEIRFFFSSSQNYVEMFLLLYICFISSYFPAINPESSSGEIVLHPLGSPVPARPKLPAILCKYLYSKLTEEKVKAIIPIQLYFLVLII